MSTRPASEGGISTCDIAFLVTHRSQGRDKDIHTHKDNAFQMCLFTEAAIHKESKKVTGSKEGKMVDGANSDG